jgi:hypothetical protein
MQVSRVEWPTAALYIVSGLAPREVARLMGCAPQDIEALLRLPEFQAMLDERRTEQLLCPGERFDRVVRAARELLSRQAVDRGPGIESRLGGAEHSARAVAEPPPKQPRPLPYSLVPEATAYLHQLAPYASIHLIHHALAATSQFPAQGGEPEVIDLPAALDWLLAYGYGS